MNRGGIAAESDATRNGIRRDASHARAPAPVNPTRPDPMSTTPPLICREESKVGTRGRDEDGRGTDRLRGYLRAPAHVRDAFDRRIADAINCDLALERECAALDDPLAIERDDQAPQLAAILGIERPVGTAGVRWDAGWQRRADRPPPKPGEPAPYSRDTDPLLALDLREVWVEITGEDVPQHGRVSCPAPKHEDRWPACSVRAGWFNCFACGAAGTVIDLGALVYGIEPRGAAFFEIRRQLLATLGIEERRAA